MTLKTRYSSKEHLPCAKATRVTTQAVGSGVGSAIIFTAAEYDLPGVPVMWSAGTNPHRLTAPIPGVYTAYASGNFEYNGTGLRMFYILHNAAVIKAITMTISGSANVSAACVSSDVNMAQGDWVEFQMYQNSGVTLNAMVYPISMGLRCVIPYTFKDWSEQ